MWFFLKAFLSSHLLRGFYAYELPGPFSVTVTKRAWAPTEYLHQVLHKRKATQTNKQIGQGLPCSRSPWSSRKDQTWNWNGWSLFFLSNDMCESTSADYSWILKKITPNYTEIFTQVKYDSWYKIALHLCSCYFLCLEYLCPPSSPDEILSLT